MIKKIINGNPTSVANQFDSATMYEQQAEIEAITNVYGSKNLAKSADTHSGGANLTYADAGNGTFTLDGTANSNSGFTYSDYFQVPVTGQYRLSGSPSEYLPDSALYIIQEGSSSAILNENTNNGIGTLTAGVNYQIRFWIKSGETYSSSKVIKPLLMDARIKDATYVPYVPTNAQLYSKIGMGITNPNLLINPWFTVNQRGFTSATNDDGLFPADRWKTIRVGTAGVITNSSGAIHVTSAGGTTHLYQIIENYIDLVGEKLVFSIKYAKGNTSTYEIKYGSKTFAAGADFTFYSDDYVELVWLNGRTCFDVAVKAECTIKAVKLEIGTVSTLHLDAAPDYTTELLKCQRYFLRIGNPTDSQYLFYGFSRTSTEWDFLFMLPTIMRANPTITYSGTIRIYVGENYYTGTAISQITPPHKSCYVNARITGSSFPTAGTVGKVLMAPTGYIDLDAEL